MLELELALIKTLPARFLTAGEIALMIQKHIEATEWLLKRALKNKKPR